MFRLLLFLISILKTNAYTNLWKNTWIPIAIIQDTDQNKIHSTKILNKDFVFWKDNNKWSIADDQCPHRAVPLSLGYLDNNKNLVCRYHDWTFDTDGKCVQNKMVEDNKTNIRSCLKTYISKEENGILWCWLGDKNITRSIDLPIEFQNFTNFITKEYPIDYEFMMENTFDPAHAIFLHSGYFGFNRKDATPIKHFIRKTNITENGFILEHSESSTKTPNMIGTRKFIAPFTNSANYFKNNKQIQSSLLFFIPIKPGYVRVFGGFKQNLDILDKIPLIKYLLASIPDFYKRLLFHINSYIIEEQDITILNPLKSKNIFHSSNWKKIYSLPTKADLGVVNFRNWFDNYSNSSIEWLIPPYILENNNKIYDRWNSHTKNCYTCQKGIKLIANIKKILITNMLIFAIISKYNIKLIYISIINWILNIYLDKLTQNFYIGKHSFN